MQSDTNVTNNLSLEGNKKIKIYRPDSYFRKLAKDLVLFLLLPVIIGTLALALIYRTPIVLLLPAILIPMTAFLCFIGYNSARKNYLILSRDGLEYHEGVISYETGWDNIRALKEARIGFKKLAGVELIQEVPMEIEERYSKWNTLGEILSIISLTPAPTPVGSRYVKGGKFIPVELFSEPATGYSAQVWQLFAQKAPWLFDEAARAARATRNPTGWAKLREPDSIFSKLPSTSADDLKN